MVKQGLRDLISADRIKGLGEVQGEAQASIASESCQSALEICCWPGFAAASRPVQSAGEPQDGIATLPSRTISVLGHMIQERLSVRLDLLRAAAMALAQGGIKPIWAAGLLPPWSVVCWASPARQRMHL